MRLRPRQRSLISSTLVLLVAYCAHLGSVGFGAEHVSPCIVDTGAGTTYGCLVTTVVGSGSPDVGDGGPAIDAVLQEPWDVLAMPDGTVLVSDTQNNRVRRFTPGGAIETIAGTGTAETQDPGDGVPAVEAQVRLPRGLYAGPLESIYLADHHYLVREIDSAGIITTVAGNRNSWYFGEGVPAREASFGLPTDVAIDAMGNVYVADAANRVRRIGQDGLIWTIAGTGEQGSSGDGGLATSAQLNQPVSLALSPGYLYIGSWLEAPIRQLDLASGVITSVPGAFGSHLTLDVSGALIFVSGNQVKRWSSVDGQITTIAGTGVSGFSGDGGFATSAEFRNPLGLSIDAAGNLYVADAGNNRIRRVGQDGVIETVAGGGISVIEGLPALEASVFDGQSLGFDAEGSLYFGDFQHRTIRRVGPDGLVRTVVGDPLTGTTSDGSHPLATFLGPPIGMEFDASGNMVFVDANLGTGVVRLVRPGSDGVVDGSADEDVITVAGQLRRREEADHGAADGGPATNAVFDAARWLTLDSSGNLYVSDAFDNRVRRITPGANGVFDGRPDEIITTVAGDGSFASSGDGGLATAASIASPGIVDVDSDDNLYILEGGFGGTRIRRVDGETGIISTYVDLSLEEQTLNVWTFKFDAQDNLYVAASTQLIRIDANTGERGVVAGTGQSGFSGDGGDALQATFRGLQYLALDSAGDIYAIDNGNFRIRKIAFVEFEQQVGVIGDADCDGAVTSIDASLILQYAAELVETLDCAVEADVDESGVVNAIDAALVLQMTAGLF